MSTTLEAATKHAITVLDVVTIGLREALAEQQAAKPATKADMAVYKAIADNYHASLPQTAEPVAAPSRAALAREVARIAGIMRDCGRYVDTSGNGQRTLQSAAAMLDQAPPQQPLTDEQAALAAEAVDQIMEQAQVFASAWSLVGGRFDAGDGMENADAEKAALRTMVVSLARQAAHSITGSKEGGAA